MSDLTAERWLPVTGYEGLYEVSDQGRVRSMDRVLNMRCGGLRAIKGRLLSPGRQASGHEFVSLWKNGQPKTQRVHRLVLIAFAGPPGEAQECAHCDGDPRNNTLRNLRWASRKENCADRELHGAQPRGSRHGMASLTESDVLKIRAEYKREGYHKSNAKILATRYGTTYKNILQVLSCKTWVHV